MSQREHWRGIMEWSYEGLPLSTPSNQACKMYDAALTQMIGFYDDPILNGLSGTFKSMFEADPNFVLGHCLKIDLMLDSTLVSPKSSPELAGLVDNLIKLADTKPNLTQRERSHVEATKLWSKGHLRRAAQTWEKILLTYPTDLHALRMAYNLYHYQGQNRQMRDTTARVLPFWQSSDIPLKGYLHGLFAYGLCETHILDKAEAQARRALEWNPSDGWAAHSLLHIFEAGVRVDEGIKFLESSVDQWKVCNYIANHNYWHKALFHIEENNYEAAASILDKNILSNLSTESSFDLTDSASLLARLTLCGHDNLVNKDQWNVIYEAIQPRLGTRILAFNDVHYLLTCLGSDHDSEADELLASLDQEDYFVPIDKEMVKTLLNSLIAYKRGKYGETVELLLPIKYDITQLGGSDVQRDLINQLLIVAAIKSKSEEHRKLASHLLLERDNLRPNSKLTASLLQQLNKI